MQISQYSGIYPSDPSYYSSSYSLNGMKFTTKDRDNDKYGAGNCAVSGPNGKNSNGWWFNNCATMQLNQKYNKIHKVFDGSSWQNYMFIEMKIRPINCN